MNSLQSQLEKKNLVSVRRNEIDSRAIQGFVVGLSDDLLALEYVYDFQIDGLLIIKRSDISQIDRTETDKFQEQLLASEGIGPGQQGPVDLELRSWKSAIAQLREQYPIMILERELGPAPEFAIGKPVRATSAQIEFRSFSGIGRWSTKTERLKYSQITSLQVNTRYINFYQRYFQQSGS